MFSQGVACATWTETALDAQVDLLLDGESGTACRREARPGAVAVAVAVAGRLGQWERRLWARLPGAGPAPSGGVVSIYPLGALLGRR